MKNQIEVEPVTLFEFRQRNLLWRWQRVIWQGQVRLSCWPHFERDGDWHPCSPRFASGVNLPAEAVPELVAVLSLAFGKGGVRHDNAA